MEAPVQLGPRIRSRLASSRFLSGRTGTLVLRAAFLWLVGYMFFVFHGLSFHLTPWSQAFINAIVGFTYDRAGQDDATVVLFLEHNLGALGLHYPVPYKVHVEVLEAIASYHPRAVFVDFAFIDPRENTDELADALCRVARRPYRAPRPVFIAAPAIASIQPGLLACADAVSPELREPEGVSGILTYDSVGGQSGLTTAAFALANSNPGLGLDEHAQEGLEIIWGKGVAPLNRQWMGCEWRWLPWQQVGVVLTKGPLALKMNCPYTRTLTVAQLLTFSGDRGIESAIRDRTILYGAAFQLTGDYFDSPVYARLPGVYLHAMAYDNLVTFGGAYKRAERNGLGAKLTDAVLLLAAAGLLVTYPRRPTKPPATFAELKRRMRTGAIAAAVGMLTLVVVVSIGGLDVGLLAAVAAYVLYRWRVNGDRGFVLLVVITLVTALFYYYVMDLGPRNILAFLVFFEVVRHVQQHVKEVARRYVELRDRERRTPRGPLWRLTDVWLSRTAASADGANGRGEVVHEPRESGIAR